VIAATNLSADVVREESMTILRELLTWGIHGFGFAIGWGLASVLLAAIGKKIP
jgi:hypothetical protein